MLFSKAAKQAGCHSGFFFGNDKGVPADAVKISDVDVQTAINLPNGADYDFDAQGNLTVMPAPLRPPEDLLNQAKAVAWFNIKTERDRRTDLSGYKVGTKWLHSDQKSRSQQLGLVLVGAKIPASLQWKTMDGSFVTMTQQLACQVLESAVASDQAIFAAAEIHKVAMEASPDPCAYDFSAGWPKGFGD